MNKNVNIIICLPPVSIKNPYQYLMTEGLKTNKKLNVINGFSSRHIGIILSALIYRHVASICAEKLKSA